MCDFTKICRLRECLTLTEKWCLYFFLFHRSLYLHFTEEAFCCRLFLAFCDQIKFLSQTVSTQLIMWDLLVVLREFCRVLFQSNVIPAYSSTYNYYNNIDIYVLIRKSSMHLTWLSFDEQDSTKYTCNPVDSVVYCSIGNPLPAGQGSLLSIRLDTSKTKASFTPIFIHVQANTSVKSGFHCFCALTHYYVLK